MLEAKEIENGFFFLYDYFGWSSISLLSVFLFTVFELLCSKNLNLNFLKERIRIDPIDILDGYVYNKRGS